MHVDNDKVIIRNLILEDDKMGMATISIMYAMHVDVDEWAWEI